MSISSSWIHGNALTIESPITYNPQGQEVSRLIPTPSGQGVWVTAPRGGERSWMHLPIPTIYENTNGFERFGLFSVSLFFQCDAESYIDFVHVYDGWEKIAEFNGPVNQGLHLTGNHLLKGNANIFILKEPYEVKRGIGLSFHFLSTQSGRPKELFVAGACANFRTRSMLNALRDLFQPKISR